MKILIIGGNGTIGKKVSSYFSKKHTVIIAGRNTGDINVDISNIESIKQLFQHIGKVDAVICIAGEAKWALFKELTEEDYYIGLRSKLMGQVNIVRIGQEFVNPSGSITLTTGILADDPVLMTASASMVNGAIHSFVKAVKLELENGIRINVVSPGLVEDAVERYIDYFPGHTAISMTKAVSGYIRSVEGKGNGEIIRIYS